MGVFMYLINFFILTSSYAWACDRCIHQSKAAFFSSDSPLSSGACGYGSLAMELSAGDLGAGVSSLYRNGTGCGACFQIRCKDNSLCNKIGAKVILSDLNTNNNTDFVLSSQAFKSMANPGKDQDILKLGIIDVEYKRIPCEYKSNLAVRVEESSTNPGYLAIKILYQGGQTDIVGIDVAKVGESNWKPMNYNHGVVWDTSKAPIGDLQFRFTVTAGNDRKVILAKHVLRANWKPGEIHNSGVQITDIAQEDCSPCIDTEWK